MLLCEVGLRYEARDVQNAVVWDLEYWVIRICLGFSSCCGKQKPTMSPLRKQGSRAKKLDSRFRGNDKYCFRNSNYLGFRI